MVKSNTITIRKITTTSTTTMMITTTLTITMLKAFMIRITFTDVETYDEVLFQDHQILLYYINRDALYDEDRIMEVEVVETVVVETVVSEILILLSTQVET